MSETEKHREKPKLKHDREKEEFDTYEPETLEYDADKINVTLWQPTIYQILRRIDQNILDLAPDFQRHSDIWDPGVKSRMIESILIRIPLPAFYIDATNEKNWVIVDGLQRLTALKQFCDNKLKLKGLEYLKELDGKTFNEIDLIYQSRIEDHQITVYRIEKGTPYQVRYNIFHRINTGGEHLTYQEIRHVLNPGAAPKLLKDMANNQDFRDTTKLGDTRIKRMEDREFVLRFFAFKLTSYREYKGGLRIFLDEAMFKLNQLYKKDRNRFEELKIEFEEVMKAAKEIFGLYAFRKPLLPLVGKPTAKNQPNRALFEIWSVILSTRDKTEIDVLKNRRDELINRFNNLKKNKEFMDSISISQGQVEQVRYRFRTIETLIKEVLND
ncbi:MAG: DUF262 domain-containing protein [Hormoscilla sp. GM7CHS1pb]|nr:DUF262 domain-containing protein [Hormoscilla sp. GM7CHS1pb]